MQVFIRPTSQLDEEIDITNRLVAAIAEDLWLQFGGNDKINWTEAECHLQSIIADVREEAKATVHVASHQDLAQRADSLFGRVWSGPLALATRTFSG